VHRRHAGIIHARRRRTGHFWQGRFGAVVMDEEHRLDPVRWHCGLWHCGDSALN
jgi:putative transposase